MYRTTPLATVFSLLLATPVLCVGADQPPKSPQDLVEYVHHAQKQGLKPEQIKKDALSAGLSAESIAQIDRLLAKLDDVKPIGARPAIAGYRIGAGDVLQIVVWKEPEASVPDAEVREDGSITIPLIREVQVAGLTPGDLEKLLTEKLQKLITDPEVTVVPKQVNSRKVYMIGAVKKEGPIKLLAPLTVFQAINEAGGLTEYAKRKKIYILRNQDGKQVRLPFNYQAAIKGEQMELNIQLLPGDSVVVPQ